MSDRARLLVAVGAALVLLAVLVIAVFFSAPLDTKYTPADWSAVWTMRWSAVTALFTALSALAIGATAIYAHLAISENQRLERVKVARELIRRFSQQKIAKAVERFATSPDGTDEAFRADVMKTLMFLDECAILRESNSVERSALFEVLAVRFVDTWLVLHRVFPRFANLEPVSISDFAAVREFVLDAQRYLDYHARRDEFPPELLESLP